MYRVAVNVPFGLVGGIMVGFIAVAGIAVLNGVALIAYLNQLRDQGQPLDHAVHSGAEIRLRTVLMTALVACFGFVPMPISTSPGAEVQRPLAAVVIGGVIPRHFSR